MLAVTACAGRGAKATTAHVGPATTVAPPRVTARLVLESAVIAAGSTEVGTLVIRNHGRAPVRLTARGAPGCTPQWGVILTNEKLPQQGSFSAECGSRPLMIPPGETRLPFALQATFAACSSTGEQEGPLMPACLPGPGGLNVAPPLPDDVYEAQVYTDAVGFPEVTSVTVRVQSAA
jgi:hypothetical protein